MDPDEVHCTFCRELVRLVYDDYDENWHCPHCGAVFRR